MKWRRALGLGVLAALISWVAEGASVLRFSVKEVYGTRGRGRTELREPIDVAVTASGDVAVLDRDRGAVVFFSELGSWLRTVADSIGPSALSLKDPAAVACDASGDLWIADTGNHRLVVLGPDGASKRVVGGLGASEGRFRLPTDITFDRGGRAYVADQGNERIQVFREDGTVFSAWDRRSKQRHERLFSPKSLAYSDHSRGFIWVVNEGSTRVESFAVDRGGEWDSGIDVATLVDGSVRLERIRIEPTFYRMFLSDSDGRRVLVVGRRGDLLGELRDAGGTSLRPAGLAVTRLLDVLVADPGARRVVRYGEKLAE